MNAAEIRETFLGFFEARDHRRVQSGSLVPGSHDPSVLLTTAGMQPFKPFFSGEQAPPHPRLTSCQKCFRTPDIEQVGRTARHLTFFEMLGNFSFGDYFKQGAVEAAWELSTSGFGFDPASIWITVFGGDEELGLDADEEAIECWRAVGVPDQRIVRLGRGENYWQAGSTGPSGPCSELYLDRGLEFGAEGDLPGDDSERFLEFWNLVFMQYELEDDGSVTPLPARNIDTGLGLDRLAAILQDVPSVYETDHFRPLIELGQELSGRSHGETPEATRALRVLADHGRGMTFLMADGVVPSNEGRGYVLRRIMRRAIQQGRVLGLDEPFLERLCARVTETMSVAYPELRTEAETVAGWAAAEEEGFGRTLAQGERLLAEIVRRTKGQGSSWVPAEDAFRLHDTYGFPFEMTQELLAGAGLAVDDEGFRELMDHAREVARGGSRREQHAGPAHEHVLDFARAAAPTRFVGYETLEVETVIAALERADGRYLAKLEESPFYAEGGGQVADGGVVETPTGRARVLDVYRVGDDQALELELEAGEPAPGGPPGGEPADGPAGDEPAAGELQSGEPARALVDRPGRLATMSNHTATHLLHAALRQRLGTHVRQAGSYVGPDKLRFDFTHGQRLSPEELADVEEQVNAWIVANQPVRAISTTRTEAEARGALALFGEKYGEWVRMVEVDGEVSRELCGGTHVGSTAEIGVFRVIAETSSASNVRRIEALTGAAGIALFRERLEQQRELAQLLRVPEGEVVGAVRRLSDQVEELSQRPRSNGAGARAQVGALVEGAEEIAGVRVVAEVVEAEDQKALLELSDQVRQTLGLSVVVLGCAADGRAHLVAGADPAAVERGVSAAEVVRSAAAVAGGGGGGRDTMAQAGGRSPEKLPDAVAAARAAIEAALS